MLRVFPSPRYCRAAGQMFLGMTGLLYLIALLLMIPAATGWIFWLIYLLVSLPFPVLRVLFYVHGSGYIILTDEHILWNRFGKEIRLAYQDIRSYENRRDLFGPFLLLSSTTESVKISRQVENYSELYAELQRRVTFFSEAPALDIPWELHLQPDYVRSSTKGFLALIGLAGLIFVLIIWLSEFPLIQIIGIPDKNLVAFGLAMISLLIAGLAVAVLLSDVNGLLSITFALSEIHLRRIWGAPVSWDADRIRSISRKRRERVYRGGTRVDQPLYVEFKDGQHLEFTDGWAEAFGIDLERLESSLHQLYPGRLVRTGFLRNEQQDSALGAQAIQRGNRLYLQGQFQDAIEAYRQAIELFPGYRFYNLVIADTLREQQRCEEAVVAYRDLLEFVPANEYGWSGLGQCLLQLEQAEEAVQAFKRALAIQPDNGVICFYAAQAYAWLEDHTNTRSCLQRALSLLPELKERARQDTSLRAYLQDFD